MEKKRTNSHQKSPEFHPHSGENSEYATISSSDVSPSPFFWNMALHSEAIFALLKKFPQVWVPWEWGGETSVYSRYNSVHLLSLYLVNLHPCDFMLSYVQKLTASEASGSDPFCKVTWVTSPPRYSNNMICFCKWLWVENGDFDMTFESWCQKIGCFRDAFSCEVTQRDVTSRGPIWLSTLKVPTFLPAWAKVNTDVIYRKLWKENHNGAEHIFWDLK